MAILVRRGLRKDFNPSKMLAGEWAVSIDTDTNNQIVWMCFAPNVVKRMGTYEDFKKQIEEATEDIRVKFKDDANDYIILCQKEVENAQAEVEKAKTEAENALESSKKAKASEDNAKTSEDNAKTSETNAKKSEDNSADNVLLSKSYAVGDTGIPSRPDEDTDNSKYYATQAKTIAEDAKKDLEDTNALLEVVRKKVETTSFKINFVTGELEYDSSSFGFNINRTTGNLEYSML